MNWFNGEVAAAIQKAISEKKVFIVFVKDENENSSTMERIWDDEDIAEICSDANCVAIKITPDSLPGQQFGAIYPILCVPSTYLINNQGIPADIIPGVVEKEEFLKRVKDAFDITLVAQIESSLASMEGETSNVVEESDADAYDIKETTSSGEMDSTESWIDLENENVTESICDEGITTDGTEIEVSSQEISHMESALQEIGDVAGTVDVNLLQTEANSPDKSKIEMMREKARLKKEEEEKQKQKEMEKKRRETGQELAIAQRELAERQARNLAKEIADRKAEDKAARERVKEQIRQDRLEKTQRFDNEKKQQQEIAKKKNEASSEEVEKRKAEANKSARILFRLPDGSSVSNTFNSDATFFLAENFIKEHLGLERVRMTTVYPKHEFNSEDMLKTFRELQLVPNASIIVSAARPLETMKSNSSFDMVSMFMYIISPILAIFNWIASIFSSPPSNENQSRQQESVAFASGGNVRDNAVRRRTAPGESSNTSNIQRLRRDDDDENATWNGNSTQQM